MKKKNDLYANDGLKWEPNMPHLRPVQFEKQLGALMRCDLFFVFCNESMDSPFSSGSVECVINCARNWKLQYNDSTRDWKRRSCERISSEKSSYSYIILSTCSAFIPPWSLQCTLIIKCLRTRNIHRPPRKDEMYGVRSIQGW